MQTAFMRYGLALSLVVAGSSLRAQEFPSPPPPPGRSAALPVVEPATGSVTGVVIAGDTQRPARFATVQLVMIQPPNAGGGGGGRFGGFGGGVAGFGGFVNVRTDVDGTFTATHVAVGDYYVFATAVGYVPEGALLRAQEAAGADPVALLAALPQVRVTADSSSNVTVTMQRGGAIAGHVEWEDGSPASGVSVNAESTSLLAAPIPTALRGIVLGPAGVVAQTDDRGNFRVTGLAAGEYLVSATVQMSSQAGGVGRLPGYNSPLRVYAPGVFRKADAKPISVRAGDERTDARLVIDLRGLHTVSGHASSANPGEAVATGGVNLADSSDGGLRPQTQIEADGGFKLRYVPPGTYTLRITGANSHAPTYAREGRGLPPNDGTKGIAYQDFSTTITVSDTDVTGVAVSLVPKQSQ